MNLYLQEFSTYWFYRNRIALLQKEEERARKKIERTKSRAIEILALRDENERRIDEWIAASHDDEEMQKMRLSKNKEYDERMRKARLDRNIKLKEKHKMDIGKLREEKKSILREIVKSESDEYRRNQEKREEVRRQLMEAKLRREAEQAERERKTREFYERKAANEAMEAKRAEKLVKALEKKEREWIAKLKETQVVQESAFGLLETALTRESASAGLEQIKESTKAMNSRK